MLACLHIAGRSQNFGSKAEAGTEKWPWDLAVRPFWPQQNQSWADGDGNPLGKELETALMVLHVRNIEMKVGERVIIVDKSFVFIFKAVKTWTSCGGEREVEEKQETWQRLPKGMGHWAQVGGGEFTFRQGIGRSVARRKELRMYVNTIILNMWRWKVFC